MCILSLRIRGHPDRITCRLFDAIANNWMRREISIPTPNLTVVYCCATRLDSQSGIYFETKFYCSDFNKSYRGQLKSHLELQPSRLELKTHRIHSNTSWRQTSVGHGSLFSAAICAGNGRNQLLPMAMESLEQ